MKKFLLSIAAVAMAASMSAASYTVFDIANPGTWTGDANGWSSSITVDGKTFEIVSSKDDSTTDLKSPVDNSYAWRVYKGSSFTISTREVTMKQITITYDDYNDGAFAKELDLSGNWTGVLNEYTFTATNEAGANTFTGVAGTAQVRIKTIVVSDEVGEVVEPDQPDVPENVVYENTFEENFDGWTKINDESLNDGDFYSGWKINTSPACLMANSYWGGANHEANAKIQREFDLSNRMDCKLEFSQAFGYLFPEAQNDYFRVYVIDGNAVAYLTMTKFPAAPESGNWTKEWATNEFDLSEFDGTTITIGFEYNNPGGSQSMAWEIKNFVLYGDKDNSAVAGIEADENAPAAYYNLQGVRVNNPESGLFIVVKGNKATKVIL